MYHPILYQLRLSHQDEWPMHTLHIFLPPLTESIAIYDYAGPHYEPCINTSYTQGLLGGSLLATGEISHRHA